MSRKFTHATAKRGRTPLIVGLVGPSGTGKTKSGLRLADGMRRVDPRKTFVVDTEAGRAKHFAKEHDFEHVDFPAPHSPDDYLEAFEYSIGKGAGRVLFDSMSHEHDGEGGVLEMHQHDMDGDMRKQLTAWSRPKQARRRLINRMVSSGADLIMCFRAQPKIKPVKNDKPIDLGFMPVGGREFMFEMTLKLLLLPGARGVPTFRSNFPGEQEMIKLPGQFEALFSRSPQLSEDIGEQLARWAGGGDAVAGSGPATAADLLTRLGACSDRDTLDLLADEARAIWPKLDASEKKRMKAALDGAAMRVKMLEAQAAAAARAMSESIAEDANGSSDAPPDVPAEIQPPAEPDRAA